MKIILTPEQEAELVKDGWLGVDFKDHRIYVEYDEDSHFVYGELVHNRDGKTVNNYSFDAVELDKLKPRKICRSLYYHYEPQCPNCDTMMIYQFENCPRCGQSLDWSE